MSGLTRLKIVLALVGVAVWGWGARTGDERFGWVAMALLAAAFLLRFRNPPKPQP